MALVCDYSTRSLTPVPLSITITSLLPLPAPPAPDILGDVQAICARAGRKHDVLRRTGFHAIMTS